MKASIVIGIEKYADKLKPVRYAAADARDFAAVLEQHGFEPRNQQLLVGEQATKTSIESTIRTTLKQLAADDTLFLYYAGQGASIEGENCIACHDTRRSDLAHTSIPLAWVFQQLRASKCRRVVLFLDAWHGELLAEEETPGLCSALDQHELCELLKTVPHAVCLAACQTVQISHRSSAWQRGIWSYHLVEAFDGRARAALTGGLLTAATLQNHLQSLVPLTLRSVQPDAVQTPWMDDASDGDCLLADLTEILARRKATGQPAAGRVKDSILLSESIASVKSLAGFSKVKGHSVPDRYGAREQTFINEAAAGEIAADLEQIRAALKREFNFTRRELKAEHHGEGAATITTPYFNYSVSVTQAIDDPSNIVWRRCVDAIVDPDKVLSTEFERVFAGVFNTVELSLHRNIDLDELIDSIEARRSDQIRVDYEEDENISSCLVTIKGHDVSIKIAGATFSVVHRRATTPNLLLKSLVDVQLALTDTHHVLTIPFDGQTAE